MIYHLKCANKTLKGEVTLSGSKSESNRVQIINFLSENKCSIQNISNSEDTLVLKKCLDEVNTSNVFDVGHAGTAMRFLTSLFAITPGERELKGSERMHQRPIKILVEALRELGAEIEYMENEGFPPLKITGKKIAGGEIEIDSTVSSQYVSSLMLVAPYFEKGLILNLLGDEVSTPYVSMTSNIMNHFSADVFIEEKKIKVEPKQYKAIDYRVESDWSSASYWYEAAGFCEEVDLNIYGLKSNGSLQSDSLVAKLYEGLGIETFALENGVNIKRTSKKSVNKFELDCTNFPDLVQTLSCSSTLCTEESVFSGLETLRIKETDRILALVNELSKLGLNVVSGKGSLSISPSDLKNNDTLIQTYDDHRMALSFAMMVYLFGEIKIFNPLVVDKSYPDFWNDLKRTGVDVGEV